MAKTVSSTTEHLRTEVEHISRVITKCSYPAWALEQMECKNFHQGRSNKDSSNNQNISNSNQNNKNKTKGYIVTPYAQGLCKSIKILVVIMASAPSLRETEQSKTYLYHLRTRTTYSTKVVSSIGTNVIELTVMRCT